MLRSVLISHSGRVRGEETWAAARDAYLAGAGAAEVCERFVLGVSALRLRARREGGRRADQPEAAPGEAEEDLEAEVAALVADPPAPSELAAEAWARAAAALGRGRLRGAWGWTELWRELTAAADVRERPERARTSAAFRAATDDACHTARSIIATMKTVDAARQVVDQPGGLHPVHSDSSALEHSATELNRL